MDATGGISISGCGTSTATCPLAVPADSGPDPALYQAGGTEAGPVGGLLLQAQAITAEASLPLQVGTANAHYLGSVPLTIAAGSSQAKLQETSQFFPTDSVDTALVTAGQLVQALSIPVSGTSSPSGPRDRRQPDEHQITRHAGSGPRPLLAQRRAGRGPG